MALLIPSLVLLPILSVMLSVSSPCNRRARVLVLFGDYKYRSHRRIHWGNPFYTTGLGDGAHGAAAEMQSKVAGMRRVQHPLQERLWAAQISLRARTLMATN